MRTVIITHNTPYPLSDGGKVAQFTIIDYLRHRCSITLLLFAHTESEYDAINTLKSIWENVTIEIVSKARPIPVAEPSMYNKALLFFLKNIDHVRYRLNKLLEPGESNITLDDITPGEKLRYLVSFAQPGEMEIIDQIVNRIETIKPDLVQLDFVDTLHLALCIPAGIKKIFVHHEVRFRRIETEINTLGNGLGGYGVYAQQLGELLEVSLLNKFDGIVAFSDEDRNLLLQKLSVKNILSLPFPVLDKEILEIKDEHLTINKLVFVGLENHSPNSDAVEWYIENLSKVVMQKFGFVLHVIGHWSKAFKIKYANNPAVHFAGFVEDVSGYCNNGIMIVPLRIGSGIRTKILHAMAWGIPVISTTIGSEGIIDKDKIFVTANTTSEFVEGICKIIEDRPMCKSMVLSAQLVLRTHYSQQGAGERRLAFYASVVQN